MVFVSLYTRLRHVFRLFNSPCYVSSEIQEEVFAFFADYNTNMLKAILTVLLVLFVVLPLLTLTITMLFYAVVGTAMLRATQTATITYVDNKEDMAPIGAGA